MTSQKILFLTDRESVFDNPVSCWLAAIKERVKDKQALAARLEQVEHNALGKHGKRKRASEVEGTNSYILFAWFIGESKEEFIKSVFFFFGEFMWFRFSEGFTFCYPTS